jgi:APA family basic amino acid/polyamine antiporter
MEMSSSNEATGRVSPSTFSRNATGLVREASLRDVLAFNVNMQNVVIGVIFSLLLIPPFYPGANIYLSTLIALLIATPVSWVYAKLSAAYPRSGGDYVFVSRIVHPAIAFMSNFSYCVWGTFYIGVSGVFLGIYGLAPMLRVLGAYEGNQSIADAGNWFARSNGKFLMAVVMIAVFTAIFIFGGLRLYLRIQAVNFLIAMVALAFVVVWALIASRGSALGHLDSQIGRLGGAPISSLAEGSTSSSFSWRETIYAAIWPWLAFNSAIYSTYMGGEIKRAARTQVTGIMGALAWAGFWTMAATWAMLHLFGNTFWANLGNADPSKYGLSTTPTFGEVSGYAVGNAVVAFLVLLGFALWSYVWIAPYTVLVTRSMLAWSLDRLAPSKLAEVNERYHSPVNALVVIAILGVVTSAFYAYGKLSVLSGTVGITASMIVVAVAGVLFPYRKREAWEASPAAGKIGNIPTITLVGLISLPLLALIEWALLEDVNSGTSIDGNPRILTYVIGIFLIGLPLYYVIRAFQKSRGINVDLAYREIPPE